MDKIQYMVQRLTILIVKTILFNFLAFYKILM